MMDRNIIDYYTIDCAISSKIEIENHYQIDFGNPEGSTMLNLKIQNIPLSCAKSPKNIIHTLFVVFFSLLEIKPTFVFQHKEKKIK